VKLPALFGGGRFEMGPSGEALEKQTDLNTVTPIGAALHMPSLFGWVVESFGGSWQGGMVLKSTQNLLAFSAVYACINLLAADISKLRLMLMRMNDGIWEEVTDPRSPFLSVLRKPNRFQTRIQFLAYWVASKLIYGNAYILLERDDRKVVRAMYPLDPRGVKPLVAGDGAVYYQMSRDALAGINEEANITVPASEIIHDRMVTLWHPLVGVSPLYACGASATQGIRIQENSAKFFENMSRPSGQLTAPGKIDEVVAERIKREFETGFAGNNIGRILVSGSDLKFQPFTIPAEQAQLIEQQRWTVEDVARAFGVPLYKVQAGNNPTFSNVGALNQEYYGQCLQTHIESIELLIDEALGLPANGMGVELDLEGLLRMDPVSRAEVADKKVKAGVLKPNEARRLDNLPPVTGGDECYLQQQNFSLAALAKRDAREDPFSGTSQPRLPAPAPKPEADEPASEEDKGLLLDLILKAA
jgi:HK97 family phage portal protein